MKTLVVGAGISGLIVARELTRVGRTVVVVEPRARVGGRIVTRHSRDGVPVDLGPEFVHGNPPETRALIPHADRDIIPLRERERVFWRGRTNPRGENSTEALLGALGERVPDVAVVRAIDEMNLNPIDRATMVSFVEGFNASDVERMSVNAMVQEARDAEDDLLNNYRLLTGYNAVTERLLGEVTAAGGDVRLNQTVREINWRPGRAVARVATADGEYEEAFGAVVNTVPIGCFADIDYAPPIPAHAAAARLLEMGDVHKVTFTFDEALWDRPADVDIDFLHSPELTFGTRWAWGWVDRFTVTCWSGGARAEALRDAGEHAIVDLALAELSLTIDRPVAEVRALVREIFYHDWVHDPHARGAYSYVLVGGEAARRDLGRSLGDTLYFAGEATDVTGAAGTVHGAIRAGQRVASELLASTAAPSNF